MEPDKKAHKTLVLQPLHKVEQEPESPAGSVPVTTMEAQPQEAAPAPAKTDGPFTVDTNLLPPVKQPVKKSQPIITWALPVILVVVLIAVAAIFYFGNRQ